MMPPSPDRRRRRRTRAHSRRRRRRARRRRRGPGPSRPGSRSACPPAPRGVAARPSQKKLRAPGQVDQGGRVARPAPLIDAGGGGGRIGERVVGEVTGGAGDLARAGELRVEEQALAQLRARFGQRVVRRRARRRGSARKAGGDAIVDERRRQRRRCGRARIAGCGREAATANAAARTTAAPRWRAAVGAADGAAVITGRR